MFLVLWCGTPAHMQTGTYFVKRTEAYASYNSWILTFTVNIEPYKQELGSIAQEMNGFQAVFQEFQQGIQLKPLGRNSTDLGNPVINDIELIISQELVQFRHDYQRLQGLMSGIELLAVKGSRRGKRALLPFIGDLMSNLFGTPSESDFRRLQRALVSLKSSEEQIAHVVSESLSIINKTEVQVAENQITIQRLTNATNIVTNELGQLNNVIRSKVIPELTALQVVAKLHDMFHVVSRALSNTEQSLLRLQEQLSQSAYGMLSMSLLRPAELVTAFKRIENKLPSDNYLPYETGDRSMLLYYKHLHPLIYSTKNKFHIIVALPIISEKAKYDIYEAITLPVPHSNLSYAAHYNLEADFLAMSKDEMSYTYLNRMDVTQCRQGLVCHMKTPIFKASQYPSCLLALFKKDHTRITENCHPIIVSLSPIPLIKPLFPGSWLISNAKPLIVTITCERQSERVTRAELKAGVNVISLRSRCAGYTEFFEIPKFISGTSQVEIETLFQKEIIFQNLSRNIWKEDPILEAGNQVVNQLLKQENISQSKQLKLPIIPISTLQSQLIAVQDRLASTHVQHRVPTLEWHHPLGIALGTVAIIAVVMYLSWKLYRRRNKLKYLQAPQIELTQIDLGDSDKHQESAPSTEKAVSKMGLTIK